MRPFSISPIAFCRRKLRWLAAPAQRRLRLALVLSLAVHTGILSLRPDAPAPERARDTSLEVILVNSQSESAPVAPKLLAQRQMDGGGTDARGHAQSPLPHTGESAQAVVLEALRERQRQLEAEQQRLLTMILGKYAAPPEQATASAWDREADPGRDDRDQAAVLRNAQIAALAERVRSYNARPRKHYFAPSASATPYAQYVDDWRSRIEAAGTEHYPAQARGQIYGSLRATVELRADGSVASVEIDRPSEHAVLNQAVRRIVQLAAPFAPFPPEIARETDVLSITRTWHFTNDRLDTQAP